jgi:hypothetical protein
MDRKGKKISPPDVQFVICGFSDKQVAAARRALTREFKKAISPSSSAPEQRCEGRAHFASMDVREHANPAMQIIRAQQAIKRDGIPMEYPETQPADSWTLNVPAFKLRLGRPGAG